jgi:hypothetical protein
VVAETVPAVTLKLALVCPAGIWYDAGTGNAVALPLDRLTDAPAVGAGPVRVISTVAVAPVASGVLPKMAMPAVGSRV